MKSAKLRFEALFCLVVVLLGVGSVAAQTWNSATSPMVSDGATVTIGVGASGTLIVPENATVTIVSSGTVNNGSREITLNISEGARVIWRANYTSSPTGGGLSTVGVVRVGGIGTFEINAGSITSGNTAIPIYTNANGAAIIVSGGTVRKSEGSYAILATGNNNVITVSGGVVEADNRAIQASTSSSTVTVSGGIVRSRSGGMAIIVSDGKLNITGGLVVGKAML